MASVTQYTIKDGDSLQGIAQIVLGDASRWTEIAILNDLDYPFISSQSYTGNVKKSGDIIMIALSDTISVPTDIGQDDGIDISTYGSDLLLYRNPNLPLGEGGELIPNTYGDLETVGGLMCLGQDLMHRLVTELGTLPYHPEYGSNFLSIIGNKNDSTWRQKAIIEVSKTFRSDPRVVDIKDINVIRISEGIQIDCNLVTPTRDVSLNETIPT